MPPTAAFALALALTALLALPAASQEGRGKRGPRGVDKAPAVGAAIPAVSAQTPDGSETVDLAKPERLTVLIFGSHT